MTSAKRIAVILPSLGQRDGEIFRGIRAYAPASGRWWLHVVGDGLAEVRDLRGWKAEGVIGVLRSREVAQEIQAWRKPAVNVSNAISPEEVPFLRVATDDIAVGEMAARYFLERGFRSFGFFGESNFWWSQCRQRGFESTLEAAGMGCTLHGDPPQTAGSPAKDQVRRRQERITRWAAALPKPTALFVVNDFQARELLELFLAAGIRVPEDLAVLGVDNEPVVCEVSRPPLSSVVTDPRRVGFQAAAALDQFLQGSHDANDLFLPPTGIVTRQSSELHATADAAVQEVLHFIQGQCHRSIGTEDVLERVSMSRRQLERRFKAALGHGIGREIQHARVDRAKRLLLETDLPIPAIAIRSGFNSPQRFNAIFRRATGQTPSGYRRRLRA